MEIDKISIIIPIYNVSDYIERCVKSVMRQTYSGKLECLLIDDCSLDDSYTKCDKLIHSYQGPIEFVMIHHEKNIGLAGARNTGTRKCTGDYLFYLDSDDEILPDCISLLVHTLRENNYPQMVIGTTIPSPNDSNYYDISRYRNIKDPITNIWIRKNFYCSSDRLPVNAWNKLISKRFIEDNSLYFLQGVNHEDEQWMFFLVKYLESLAFVFEPTLIHYKNANSIMSTNNIEKAAKNWGTILESFICHFDSPCYKEQVLLSFWQFIVTYGCLDHKAKYDILYRKFKDILFADQEYLLVGLSLLFKYTYPIIRGKGLRKIINKLIIYKIQ